MSDMEFFAGVFDDCNNDSEILMKYASLMISVASAVDKAESKEDIVQAVLLSTLVALERAEELEK